jgi:AraC family transcriptional regulator, regulatory protein of adaptative response / DNA-3-methyladenine glycosylase II
MRTTSLYQALRSRDRRFDGTFFVGVTTTGIYCRPVCPARLPQERNCAFYDTAPQAERDGFRPCLRCRPELAPGRAIVDAQVRLATAAYARIGAGALNGRSVADLARELCVGERQLRRAVAAEFGVPPVELAQTQRLLVAKQLLTETDLPVLRVAYASGFGSLTRFNTLFLQRYGLSPTRLRAQRRSAVRHNGSVTLKFAYRPPFAWDRLLGFLAGRATPGVEVVSGDSYTRTVRQAGVTGWIRARPARSGAALDVEISESLVPALMPLRAAVRRLFDLDAEPASVAEHFALDPLLGPLVRRRPGLRLPGGMDAFELAVRAVLGQQVTVAAATTIAGRLAAALGEPFDGPDGLDRLPVTAAALAAAQPDLISRLGMPRARARTLVLLAQATVCGDVDFASTDVTAALVALKRVPGIGDWTAQYIAMRAFHWPDAFPATDLALVRALARTAAGAADPIDTAETWRPWRAYAVMYLWDSLNP